MLNLSLNRMWQERIFTFLIFLICGVGALGLYVLHVSPYLIFDADSPYQFLPQKIKKIENMEINPEFFNKLPEFFLAKEEKAWWNKHEEIYEVLAGKHSVSIEFQNKNEILKDEIAIGPMPFSKVLEKIGLLYLVGFIYLVSATIVFKKHKSTDGTLLTSFLLFGSLYILSSGPVTERIITLDPFYFKMLTMLIHFSSGGLITIVHFAFLFPTPKKILLEYPSIPYVLYGYCLLTALLYATGITSFGVTFPFLFFWIFSMVGAFIHSLIKETDPFLKKQINLTLLAPLITGSVFVFLYLLPGTMGKSGMNITQVALFSLIIPFALPSAMDNLYLYKERLMIEKNSQAEKEQLREDLHDTLGCEFTNIRFLCETAEQYSEGNSEKGKDIIRTIKDASLKGMGYIREFLWAIDTEEGTMEKTIFQLNTYSYALFNHLNMEIDFKMAEDIKKIRLNSYFRFHIFNIYKEAIINIIKHSKADKVEIDISRNNGEIIMRIKDNGVGINMDNDISDSCCGIKNMKKRAEKIGGRFTLLSENGKSGTEIRVIIPQNTTAG